MQSVLLCLPWQGMIMTGIYRNIFVCLCALAAQNANADEALVIRGDQSAAMLSDIPALVDDSHEIFAVRPRLTKREELILLLGNAELFVTPPVEPNRADTSTLTKENTISEKNSSIGVSP